VSIILGDCVTVMAGMKPESVDAIVCDPPYGLEFMGKEWDRLAFAGGGNTGKVTGTGINRNAPRFYYQKGAEQQAFHARWAEAAYRVAKPSAYLLAFGGTRTVHRMTVALEDAGWIIRDMLVWGYASGFPKSKASLKPAWEPIVMARKPGPLRMLAIDECRLPVSADDPMQSAVWTTRAGSEATILVNPEGTKRSTAQPLGRWPANIVLTATEDGRAIFDGGVEGVVGGGETSVSRGGNSTQIDVGSGRYNWNAGKRDTTPDGIDPGYGDSGTYSRFFLIPKSARSDREPVLGGLPERSEGDGTTVRNARCEACGKVKFAADADRCHCDKPVWKASSLRQNVHPTVKPTDLMRHLVRLVTPTGGTVLDPFLGSGTTGLAAEMEGFAWIGIEREAEYVRIAEARLNGTQRGLGLEAS
jgi:DNA modification methylase